VKGFGPFVSENQLLELFRRYAVVKSVFIVRDRQSNVSRGIAFVEFNAVEHATYALQSSVGLQIDKNTLKINYAREGIVQQQIALAQTHANQISNMMYNPNPWGAGAIAPGNPYAFPGVMPTLMQSVPLAMQLPSNMPMGKPNLPLIHPGMARVKPTWPPNFDTHGASYVFQAQSGYFLDSITDFYYCPKSKLYYSGTDGKYFTYDATLNPPFKPHTIPLPSESHRAPAAIEASSSQSTAISIAEAMSKKPIIMSLSGNAKNKGKGVFNVGVSKKVVDNLAKWEAAKQEADNDHASSDSSVFGKADKLKSSQVSSISLESALLSSSLLQMPIPAAQPTAIAEKPANSSEAAVDANASNQAAVKSDEPPVPQANANTFICYLCRRQFNSADQLKRHENESKLHAENLAKQNANEDDSIPTTVPAGGVVYRDRASERRAIQGTTGAPTSLKEKGKFKEKKVDQDIGRYASSSIVHQSVSVSGSGAVPEVALSTDLSNPGNQLLRKMGWSEGKGLGKDEQGREIAVGVEASGGPRGNAGIGAEASSVTSHIAYSGEGQEYRESLLKATKARFDQISQISENKK